MRTVRIFSILFIVILSGHSLLWAESYYIKSHKVRLTQGPGHKTQLNDVLKRGDKVEKIGAEKSWVKIRTDEMEGWIHKFALSKRPPRKRVSLLAKKVDITSKARKRASTFTTSAAARGLLDTRKNNLIQEGNPDFIALARMEDQVADMEEAIRFINEDE
ncbi:MAG: hypothetical protein GY866_19425 [Proteobacteria bacterium]|nr:hypothetical protein [Pseudomonadota bacterium]